VVMHFIEHVENTNCYSYPYVVAHRYLVQMSLLGNIYVKSSVILCITRCCVFVM